MNQFHRFPSGDGQNRVPVRLGLVAAFFLVRAGPLHIVKRINDRRRRRHIQQLNAFHQNPRAVTVHAGLNGGQSLLLDFTAALGQGGHDGLFPHNLAQDTFGHGFHRNLRIAHVKQIIPAAFDAPEHNKINIHDVFITGEHHALVRNIFPRTAVHVIAGKTTAAAGCGTKANGDPVFPRHHGALHGPDGIGPVIMQTWGGRLGLVRPFPKQHFNAHLIGFHAVKSGQQPQRHRRHQQQSHQIAGIPAGGQGVFEIALEFIDQIIQIYGVF